jgi:uncharacterized protein with PIN domain
VSLRQALARARGERRILLTRSTALLRLGFPPPQAGSLRIVSERPRDQLIEVARTLPIFPSAAPFTRCSDCNALLEPADPAWARPRVPPFVARTRHRFHVCPVCQRIYWSATHTCQISLFFNEIAESLGQSLPAQEQAEDAGSGEPNPAPRKVRPEGNPSP